jgi:hypothetical protein
MLGVVLSQKFQVGGYRSSSVEERGRRALRD